MEYTLQTSSAKIKSKTPMLAVGRQAVARGGSLPGCESSLPQIFMVALALSGSRVCEGRQGARPPGAVRRSGVAAEMGGIPHLYAEWLHGEVTGASSSLFLSSHYLPTPLL